MQNLLSIETAFLNLQAVKNALNLTEIRSLQRTINNAKKKKFEQTLTLSKLVKQSVEWFNSEEGQRVCNEEGISWSNEEIGQKVFGWQKSFFYKVVKAGELSSEVIESFGTQCNDIESQGEEPNRSLEGLLKYAKQVESSTQDGGQVEVRRAIILKLSYKKEGSNVSVKIDCNGDVKTTNSIEDILEAVAFLSFKLNNLNS